VGQIMVWWVWTLMKERNGFTKGLAALVIAAEVYLPVWFAVPSGFAAMRLLDRAKPEASTSKTSPATVYFPFVTALAVVSVIGYIYVFSLTFYPAIPPAIGGGKPYFESLVIAEEGRCLLQQLGMPFHDEQPNLTMFLPVLHESDTLVAVWLETETKNQTDDPEHWHSVVVQLDKTQISAAVADPRETKPQQLLLPPVPCKPSSSSGETHGHRR
jgi:hypothetical protein